MSRHLWLGFSRLTSAAAVLVALCVGSAQAALTYYEPFDYTVGESVDAQAAWETEKRREQRRPAAARSAPAALPVPPAWSPPAATHS